MLKSADNSASDFKVFDLNSFHWSYMGGLEQSKIASKKRFYGTNALISIQKPVGSKSSIHFANKLPTPHDLSKERW